MEIALITYLGELRTQAVHLQSQTRLITDAPLDNNGKGEAFSPTDLLGTSLGSCMLTIMGIVSSRSGIAIKGTEIRLTKIMGVNPRRVTEIQVEIFFPADYTEKEKNLLENAALTCPVAKSIHPEIRQVVHFNYKTQRP